MQPFPEDWGRDLGHLNSVFEAENGFVPLDASLLGSSDHGTATTVDADEMSDRTAPKKSTARRGAKNPVQNARQRASNNAAVARYREKKRQKQEEVAAMLAETQQAIELVKQEQTELSYVQTALTKMAEYANDVISTVSNLMGRSIPQFFGGNSSSTIHTQNPNFAPGTWYDVLTSFSVTQLRYSITKGLLALPPDAVLRYQVLRMDIESVLEARAGYARKMYELTQQYDTDPALRSSIESVIQVMFHFWVRTMKVLVENRPDLLHQAIERLSQREAKSPEALREFLNVLELKQSQFEAIARLHRENIISTPSIRTEAVRMQEMARQMSQAEMPSTLQGLGEDHLKLLTLLQSTKELTSYVSDSVMSLSIHVVNELSAIQLARTVTFYYPNVPDVLELARTISDYRDKQVNTSGPLQITNADVAIGTEQMTN